MRNNGSPDPVFKTDDLNQYFLAELPIHPAFIGDNVAQDVVDRLDLIVLLLKEDNTLSAAQLAKQLGVTARTIQRDLEKLSKAERIKHIVQIREDIGKSCNNHIVLLEYYSLRA